ncbi:predicted protein [Chaetoceros tenuissimus]|uniref:t-SNARE coiled-coil homology domain-containing protein n=1 Tax=Chaetoceros tenuissimus TaxID=426638 RepID=A0AAD3H677_9STRA|nr:predicted protein [Chaetoceros tenuissimus]
MESNSAPKAPKKTVVPMKDSRRRKIFGSSYANTCVDGPSYPVLLERMMYDKSNFIDNNENIQKENRKPRMPKFGKVLKKQSNHLNPIDNNVEKVDMKNKKVQDNLSTICEYPMTKGCIIKPQDTQTEVSALSMTSPQTAMSKRMLEKIQRKSNAENQFNRDKYFIQSKKSIVPKDESQFADSRVNNTKTTQIPKLALSQYELEMYPDPDLSLDFSDDTELSSKPSSGAFSLELERKNGYVSSLSSKSTSVSESTSRGSRSSSNIETQEHSERFEVESKHSTKNKNGPKSAVARVISGMKGMVSVCFTPNIPDSPSYKVAHDDWNILCRRNRGL